MPASGAELADRCREIYTAAIADALDRRGLISQTLPPELLPLREGVVLAGPAYPIKGRPAPGSDYDTSLRSVLEMLGSVPAGYVSVYETDDLTTAHLGELSVTALKARGVQGAVIDGGCRDVDFILREGFPIFCRHTTPQDSTGRWSLVGHGDVEVEIGGVRIALGDWVVGDRDGIVVIPATLAESVVSEAEEKVRTESEIRLAVRGGMSPLEAYDRFDTF
jgi:4-hydroxy-4-methyl-2-oxoglutarate aldolase